MLTDNPPQHEASHKVNLLISLLIRYPHLTNIHYDAEDNRVKLVFALAELPKAQWISFQRACGAHLEVLHLLSGSQPTHVKITRTNHGLLWQLEIERDVATLTRAELNVLVGIVTEHFTKQLIVEENAVDENDYLQDEVIDYLLSQSEVDAEESLIGFREKGKVMVFTHLSRSEENSQGL